jgi:hypothetical protein
VTDDAWADITAMCDRLADYTPPEPVKLTRQQWDSAKGALLCCCGAGQPGPSIGPSPLWGVPIQTVATVEESTPYRKGWAGWRVADDSPDRMINNKEGT